MRQLPYTTQACFSHKSEDGGCQPQSYLTISTRGVEGKKAWKEMAHCSPGDGPAGGAGSWLTNLRRAAFELQTPDGSGLRLGPHSGGHSALPSSTHGLRPSSSSHMGLRATGQFVPHPGVLLFSATLWPLSLPEKY